jgi:ABC-2 type transport system ATP-binding protein
MDNTVIVVNDLVHRYGSRTAVNHLSFNVRRGEVLGLLGPNGAGKTTMVRLLNGLFKPSSGEMRVAGFDPTREGDKVRQISGVLTETPALYERLTARQNLEFFGTLAKMDANALKTSCNELLGFFDLQERENEKVAAFSKGMKQRLALARALLNHPPLLFLDEPTSGLDPEAAQQVHQLITDVREKNGQTVLLCTHHLEEAQRLCDRLAIIHEGRLLAFGSLDELRQMVLPGLWVDLSFYSPAPQGLKENLHDLAGVQQVDENQGNFSLLVEGESVVPGIVELCVAKGAKLLGLQPRSVSLEAIYFELQKRQQAGVL